MKARRNRTTPASTFTPAEQQRLAQRVIDRAREDGSIGSIERLAGIEGETARRDFWNQFRHLFRGPVQPLFDAGMGECRRRIIANGIDWVAL